MFRLKNMPIEQRKRYLSYIFWGLVAVWAILLLTDVPRGWRLIPALPASLIIYLYFMPSNKTLDDLMKYKHLENPSTEEIKAYRAAHPDVGFTEAILELKKEKAGTP